MSSLQSLVVIALIFLFSIAEATVPDSQTFKFVNNGEFGNSMAEYNASYRALNIFTFPFQLCFYNTTPGGYSLGLSMGSSGPAGHPESPLRWVWEANRGNLVGENASFSFGKDGNLVLAEADGDIVWQSATVNKGVVGFRLLPNGKMVLYDSNGNHIWQSFDSPTDTLLVGQSLQTKGPTYLASRASPSQTVNGKYSLMLESQRLALYRDNKNSPTVWIQIGRGSLEYVRFNSEPRTHSLRLEYKVANSSTNGAAIIAFPTFNTTLTYLRLGIDGNMKAFTYEYDTRTQVGSWSETFTLFLN